MNNDKPDERIATAITKEEISAMVDGEVSEFALRRILKESENNPKHALQWEKYQVISSVLKGDIEPIAFADISSKVMQAIQKDKLLPLSIQNSAAQKLGTQTGEVLPFKSAKNEKDSIKKPHQPSSTGLSQRKIGFGLAASCAIAFFSWQHLSSQQAPSFAQTENQTANSIAETRSDTLSSTKQLAEKAKKTTSDQEAQSYRYASTESNAALQKSNTVAQKDDEESNTKMENINGKEVLWVNDFDLAQDSELARTSNHYWMLHHGSQGFKASSTGAMPYSRMINWQMSHTNQGTYRQTPSTPVQLNETLSSPVIVR